MRKMLYVAAAVLLLLTGCLGLGADVRAVTIRNDTEKEVILKICDSFGCDNLNDHVAPGESIRENVSSDFDPYEFLVVDDSGQRLGCLEIPTRPVRTSAIVVSSLVECS
jgi:hypothetical protein